MHDAMNRQSPAVGESVLRIKRFDSFFIFNTVLLIGSTLYGFTVSEPEFGLYAVVILVLGVLVWHNLRRYEYPVWLLALLQIAIFAHFAGGFIFVGEDPHSLYWHHILGFRFDKIVHTFNSAVGALAMMHIFSQAGLKLRPMKPFVVIMVVGGLGSAVEVMEYFAVRTIPRTGVGDHANTVEDMVMNFLGAAIGVAIAYAIANYRARSPKRSDAGVQ